jgi:hypothetical protein
LQYDAPAIYGELRPLATIQAWFDVDLRVWPKPFHPKTPRPSWLILEYHAPLAFGVVESNRVVVASLRGLRLCIRGQLFDTHRSDFDSSLLKRNLNPILNQNAYLAAAPDFKMSHCQEAASKGVVW